MDFFFFSISKSLGWFYIIDKSVIMHKIILKINKVSAEIISSQSLNHFIKIHSKQDE